MYTGNPISPLHPCLLSLTLLPVGSLAGVRAHVRRHRGALGETPVAHRAPERLLAGVGAHVCRQVGRLREGLVAVDAAVGLFTAVGAQVGLQGAGPGIALSCNQGRLFSPGSVLIL